MHTKVKILPLLLLIVTFFFYSDYVRLERDIMECPYSVWEFKESVFDCSNMVVMLSTWLDEKGYEVQFCRGTHKDGGVHAWLIVDGMYVESTSKLVLNKKYFIHYFKNISCGRTPEEARMNISEDAMYFPKIW